MNVQRVLSALVGRKQNEEPTSLHTTPPISTRKQSQTGSPSFASAQNGTNTFPIAGEPDLSRTTQPYRAAFLFDVINLASYESNSAVPNQMSKILYLTCQGK